MNNAERLAHRLVLGALVNATPEARAAVVHLLQQFELKAAPLDEEGRGVAGEVRLLLGIGRTP